MHELAPNDRKMLVTLLFGSDLLLAQQDQWKTYVGVVGHAGSKRNSKAGHANPVTSSST